MQFLVLFQNEMFFCIKKCPGAWKMVVGGWEIWRIWLNLMSSVSEFLQSHPGNMWPSIVILATCGHVLSSWQYVAEYCHEEKSYLVDHAFHPVADKLPQVNALVRSQKAVMGYGRLIDSHHYLVFMQFLFWKAFGWFIRVKALS